MNRLVSGWSIELLVAVSLTMAALAALSVRLTSATEPPGVTLAVSGAWARPSLGNNANSALYMTIENTGSDDDRLIRVSTPAAKTAEIHATTNDGGVMRMRHVSDGVGIGAGETFLFKPAGHHVMLMGLTAPLKTGETFPLTLVFEKAGEIEVSVPVSKGPAAGGAHKHH